MRLKLKQGTIEFIENLMNSDSGHANTFSCARTFTASDFEQCPENQYPQYTFSTTTTGGVEYGLFGQEISEMTVKFK